MVRGQDVAQESLEIVTSGCFVEISHVERFNRNNGEKGLLLATGGMDKRVSVFHVSFPATKRMV